MGSSMIKTYQNPCRMPICSMVLEYESLHLAQKSTSFVGNYSSTMVRIWVSKAMEKLHQRSQEHLRFWQPVIAEVVKAILAECQESKRPIIFAAEPNRSSWVLLGPAGWMAQGGAPVVCVYIHIYIYI